MGKQVRITGLVRVANSVRRELTSPLTAERRTRLREMVATHLEQVHQILRNNQAALTHLPPPSQRTYHYLAKLEWSQAAIVPSGTAPAALSIYSWPGLKTLLDHTLNRLAVDVSEKELEEIGDAIARTSRRIELTIQRDAVTPDRLSPATRAQRGWLAFFSRRENLLAYVQSRRLASTRLNAAAAGSRYYPPPLNIQFRPMDGIYKFRGNAHQAPAHAAHADDGSRR